MTHRPPADSPKSKSLDALGRAVAAAQDEALQRQSWVREARAGLFGRARARVRPRLWAPALVVPAAAAATVALWLVLRPSPTPLAFEVGQARTPGETGTWLVASDKPLPLRFSDGSVVSLDPATSARVDALGTRGAVVVLERGRADVAVRHLPAADWRVRAGPFEVRVIGTRFAVDWDAASRVFAVSMLEGSVRVTGGPLGARGRDLVAGERLQSALGDVASVAPNGTDALAASGTRVPSQRDEDAAGASTLALSAQARSSAPADVAPGRRTAAPARKAAATAANEADVHHAPVATPTPNASGSDAEAWRNAFAAGRYAEAWAAVEADFEARCASASASELLDIADAARLASRSGAAARAWTAIRARFAATPQAASAAFALGRRAFDELRDYREAAAWFGTCRAEQPNGPLAREAAGRRLEALARAGARAEARTAALEYLAAYPTGPHAMMARGVVESNAE